MRFTLALALLILPATAQAAIRPTQAEIVVEDARDPGQATLDLDLMDGRRIAFHLACRGDGRTVGCTLTRKGKTVATTRLDPNAALSPAGSRQIVCQTTGVLLTLSASDLIQTLPAPIADSYHFRASATPASGGKAPACPT